MRQKERSSRSASSSTNPAEPSVFTFEMWESHTRYRPAGTQLLRPDSVSWRLRTRFAETPRSAGSSCSCSSPREEPALGAATPGAASLSCKAYLSRRPRGAVRAAALRAAGSSSGLLVRLQVPPGPSPASGSGHASPSLSSRGGPSPLSAPSGPPPHRLPPPFTPACCTPSSNTGGPAGPALQGGLCWGRSAWTLAGQGGQDIRPAMLGGLRLRGQLLRQKVLEAPFRRGESEAPQAQH